MWFRTICINRQSHTEPCLKSKYLILEVFLATCNQKQRCENSPIIYEVASEVWGVQLPLLTAGSLDISFPAPELHNCNLSHELNSRCREYLHLGEIGNQLAVEFTTGLSPRLAIQV